MGQVSPLRQRIEHVPPVFVAAYACPAGDLGAEYLGYFRVFEHPVTGYFDAGSVATGMAPKRYRSPDEALDAAIEAGRARLGGPVPGCRVADPEAPCLPDAPPQV